MPLLNKPRRLEDRDPMPWGKHAGVTMESLSASYLHFLWINGKREDHGCLVADYIRRNIKALEYELSDRIWD